MVYTYDYPHYAITADVVVFTIRNNVLQVLLIKRGLAPFKGRWALPGGFLRPDEDLEACARRELEEETGVSGFYLEQLYTFGAIKRDPRERVVTVAYFALIRSDAVTLQAASDAAGAAWVAMEELPQLSLAFDHEQIVAAARERVAAKLEYSTIAFQFLPERFTMRELHTVYETVLGKPLDRRNFYKKMLASGELLETAETRLEGAHRPAAVYRLRHPGEVRITR
jgi:8-oxo-dGTP diphosphatase